MSTLTYGYQHLLFVGSVRSPCAFVGSFLSRGDARQKALQQGLVLFHVYTRNHEEVLVEYDVLNCKSIAIVLRDARYRTVRYKEKINTLIQQSNYSLQYCTNWSSVLEMRWSGLSNKANGTHHFLAQLSDPISPRKYLDPIGMKSQ